MYRLAASVSCDPSTITVIGVSVSCEYVPARVGYMRISRWLSRFARCVRSDKIVKVGFGKTIRGYPKELIEWYWALLVWHPQHAIADRVFGASDVARRLKLSSGSADAHQVPVIYNNRYSLPLGAEDAAWLRGQCKRSVLITPLALGEVG